MTLDRALAELKSRIAPGRAEGAAAYHKVERAYLGVTNPDLNELAKTWQRDLEVEARVRLADDLWITDIFEDRIVAAKLLTRARIRPDRAVWALIKSWVADFDSWAIADHACMAGHPRLVAEPLRLGELEPWTQSDHMWTRRAALVMSLPWARMKQPNKAELDGRERILGWAAAYTTDADWFIQKSVAWWVRELSKRDPDRAAKFLADHGTKMKTFARKDAGKYLSSSGG